MKITLYNYAGHVLFRIYMPRIMLGSYNTSSVEQGLIFCIGNSKLQHLEVLFRRQIFCDTTRVSSYSDMQTAFFFLQRSTIHLPPLFSVA
jgi:hypothetical protein